MSHSHFRRPKNSFFINLKGLMYTSSSAEDLCDINFQ